MTSQPVGWGKGSAASEGGWWRLASRADPWYRVRGFLLAATLTIGAIQPAWGLPWINPDCSGSYIGDATLNEVFFQSQGNKVDAYVEVKILDTSISSANFQDWSITVCQGTESSCEQASLPASTSTYPYVVVDPSDAFATRLDFREPFDLALRDDAGDLIDYLSVGGSSYQEETCGFPYDTDAPTNNSFDLRRIPDGTGDWAYLPGNSGSPTEGANNEAGGGGGSGGGDFNAFETGTASGSTEGPLYTKVSGVDFAVDVVSINQGGNLRNFNGDVQLELVQAGSATSCDALTVLADFGSYAMNGERETVSGLNYGGAVDQARLRMTEVTNSPNSRQGCSTDVFTVRPHHLSLAGQDSDWANPGTARTLDGDNSDACQAGGGAETCHKAGNSFTLTGLARAADGTVISQSFDAVASVGWALHSSHDGDDSLGTHTPSTLSFPGDGSGARTDAAIYREVGLVSLTLNDQGGFATTSNDPGNDHCISGSSSNSPDGQGRYGCQTATEAPATVGRFVPNRFLVGHSDFGFAPACSAGSTYFGQPFGWSATPQVTITAVEQGGNTTTNYEDGFWKLADYSDAYEDDSQTDESANDGDDFSLDATNASHAWPDTTDVNGQITVDYAGTLTYSRPGSPVAPVASGNQGVKLRFDIEDADGVHFQGGSNPPTYLISWITGAGSVRFGRLDLQNAHGPETEDLSVPVQAQYYAGSQFRVNGLDSCTPLSITDAADQARIQSEDGGAWRKGEDTVALQGGTGGATEIKSSSSALVAGTGSMVFDAPNAGNTGFVDVRIDLADLPWLRGDWDHDGAFDDFPVGRVTFGRYTGNEHILYWQEVFQ